MHALLTHEEDKKLIEGPILTPTSVPLPSSLKENLHTALLEDSPRKSSKNTATTTTTTTNNNNNNSNRGSTSNTQNTTKIKAQVNQAQPEQASEEPSKSRRRRRHKNDNSGTTKANEHVTQDFIESKNPAQASTLPPVYQDYAPPTEADRTQDPALLHYPRSCYICKVRFYKLHHFYDQMCPRCGELSWEKRNQTANMQGRVCLVTGARVKIGFECGLKLLRCGATVIVTTRFPHDCAKRYAQQKDFSDWSSQLHVYGLDMRDLKSVVRFTDMIRERFTRLDVIVNNAAQTVRRPAIYYQHLMKEELKPRSLLPPEIRSTIGPDPHRQEADGSPGHIHFVRGNLPIASNITIHPGNEETQESVPEEKRDSEIISSVMNTITGTDESGSVSAGLRELFGFWVWVLGFRF